MKPVRGAIVAVVVLGVMAGKAVAQSTEWKALIPVDLTKPGPMSWIASDIWPDVAAKENAYLRDVLKRQLPAGGASLRLLHALLEGEGSTYSVSVVLTRDCESGANHNASSAEPSVCPMRIARKQADGWKVIAADRGCYVDPQEVSALAAHRHDGAQIQFEPGKKQIRLRANVGGVWNAACTRSLPLP